MGFDKVTKEEVRKFAMEEFEADLKMGDVSTSEAEILDYFFWNVIPSNWNVPEDRAHEWIL